MNRRPAELNNSKMILPVYYNNGTLIVSAFPACGKSYCYNNYKSLSNINSQEGYSMLDSDSSKYS